MFLTHEKCVELESSMIKMLQLAQEDEDESVTKLHKAMQLTAIRATIQTLQEYERMKEAASSESPHKDCQ